MKEPNGEIFNVGSGVAATTVKEVMKHLKISIIPNKYKYKENFVQRI